MSGVIICPYSSEWPMFFDARRAVLRSVWAPVDVAIEHIGSTSVPGLAAKPVIDVLLGARTLAEIEAKVAPLGALGYADVPKYEVELRERRYFANASATSLRVHLHAVEHESRIWREHLAFRDRRRADAGLRDQYQALKLRLADAHAHDKAAYSEAKGPFIRSVLADSFGTNVTPP